MHRSAVGTARTISRAAKTRLASAGAWTFRADWTPQESAVGRVRTRRTFAVPKTTARLGAIVGKSSRLVGLMLPGSAVEHARLGKRARKARSPDSAPATDDNGRVTNAHNNGLCECRARFSFAYKKELVRLLLLNDRSGYGNVLAWASEFMSTELFQVFIHAVTLRARCE